MYVFSDWLDIPYIFRISLSAFSIKFYHKRDSGRFSVNFSVIFWFFGFLVFWFICFSFFWILSFFFLCFIFILYYTMYVFLQFTSIHFSLMYCCWVFRINVIGAKKKRGDKRREEKRRGGRIGVVEEIRQKETEKNLFNYRAKWFTSKQG